MSFAIHAPPLAILARMPSFNSLFVGMSFAITDSLQDHKSRHLGFQFPFRRDELCNQGKTKGPDPEGGIEFQFPFRRDELCNDNATGCGR